jgi:uncharacterized membrane-anchored protein YitT (DUF2179 family)
MTSSTGEQAAQLRFSWAGVRDFALILAGVALQAGAFRVFLVPAHLVNGGVAGLAQIINYYTGWPIGVMILLGNAPLFILGWRFLGGRAFALRTAFAVVMVSFLIDLPLGFLPSAGLTDDMVLNTLYGGLISGVGYGLVYRGQGTSGGSDILARILHHWRGIPLSTSYLMTDALIMFLGGLAFSWNNALYALVLLYISGIAAEGVTEGANLLRTAMIITSCPEAVTQQILHQMARGVTLIPARGAYTQTEHTVLYCVVTRSEVARIKALVKEADPRAFMVIGQAHEALGEGFRSFEK